MSRDRDSGVMGKVRVRILGTFRVGVLGRVRGAGPVGNVVRAIAMAGGNLPSNASFRIP